MAILGACSRAEAPDRHTRVMPVSSPSEGPLHPVCVAAALPQACVRQRCMLDNNKHAKRPTLVQLLLCLT